MSFVIARMEEWVNPPFLAQVTDLQLQIQRLGSLGWATGLVWRGGGEDKKHEICRTAAFGGHLFIFFLDRGWIYLSQTFFVHAIAK